MFVFFILNRSEPVMHHTLRHLSKPHMSFFSLSLRKISDVVFKLVPRESLDSVRSWVLHAQYHTAMEPTYPEKHLQGTRGDLREQVQPLLHEKKQKQQKHKHTQEDSKQTGFVEEIMVPASKVLHNICNRTSLKINCCGPGYYSRYPPLRYFQIRGLRVLLQRLQNPVPPHSASRLSAAPVLSSKTGASKVIHYSYELTVQNEILPLGAVVDHAHH